MSQEIILIAAMSENQVIGIENHLPWHLPGDWENFKMVTAGHPFIMGRKSYESEDMLYSEEANIVLSRKAKYPLPDKFEQAKSLSEALRLLKSYPRIFILGGESVFRESLPLATHLFLTEVQTIVLGDTKFPTVAWEDWKKYKSDYFPADARHEFGFYINEYERV